MIERYEVFYRDTFIGLLSVESETNRYAYEPDVTGVKEVEDRACLLRVMQEGTDGFGDPIPFFANRLYNMKRVGRHEVNYQTDYFLIREIVPHE